VIAKALARLLIQQGIISKETFIATMSEVAKEELEESEELTNFLGQTFAQILDQLRSGRSAPKARPQANHRANNVECFPSKRTWNRNRGAGGPGVTTKTRRSGISSMSCGITKAGRELPKLDRPGERDRRRVIPDIDCTACANCCRSIHRRPDAGRYSPPGRRALHLPAG